MKEVIALVILCIWTYNLYKTGQVFTLAKYKAERQSWVLSLSGWTIVVSFYLSFIL